MLRRITAGAQQLKPLLGPRTRSRLSTCAALAALASLRTPLLSAQHHTRLGSLTYPAQLSLSPLSRQARTMVTAAPPTAIGDIPAYDPWTSSPARYPFVEGQDVFKNLLPGYTVVPATDGLAAYAMFEQPLQRSQNDDREYRLIMLENGLEALLIRDAKTDQASAALDVKVGHLADPEDLQGLAHFCEHLLFMGTEKYPREADYSEYLTQHGGASNAFTGMDQTNYYFDVHPSGLDGALDRFSQFFIAPVFDPNTTEREANAVDSENSKNLQVDMWRLYQLDKTTSSKDHVYWRFGTGNKHTLWDWPLEKGVDVRARLIEWQEKNYSANLMKLVVLSNENLDTLTASVVDKFGPVVNKDLRAPDYTGTPYGKEQQGTTVLVKTVKDVRSLEISFPFPDDSTLYMTKPGSFLSHLIGHEGPGSILSLLKKRGWANGCGAGAGNGARGFEFFKITIDLTEEGLANHEQVASAVFQYIALLKATPPQQWIFDEVAQLAEMSFRFKEKSPATSTSLNLSLQMSRPYPRAELLSAPYLSRKWNADLIAAAAKELSPERCRITIASHHEIEGRKYELVEPWYGTEYTVRPTSEAVLKSETTNGGFDELALPKVNEFIPKNVEIKDKLEVDKPALKPLSLYNSPTLRVWHKKDDRWWVPRASAFVLLRSPVVDETALAAVQCRIFTELVRDALVEYSYDADLAGLSYNFDIQADGVLLSMDGYNDKLSHLNEVVIDKIRNIQVDPQRFTLIADQLKRALLNFRHEQPYQHVTLSVLDLTQKTHWTYEQRLAVFDVMTVENLTAWIASFVERMHIEVFVHGNMLADEALALAKTAERILGPKPLTSRELLSHQALVIPEGHALSREMSGSAENTNNAVEQFTYVGDVRDDLLRCKMSVLGQMIRDPVFDVLRTQEQLGYIVMSGARKSIAFMGLRVIAQSERSAEHVEARIAAFWDHYKNVIAEMGDDEFDKYKTAVVNKKLEDHKNMWQESMHIWTQIHGGWLDFTQKERDAEITKTITKQDMVDFFNQYFIGSAEKPVRRLSVHLESQRLSPDACASLLPYFEQLQIEVDPAQAAAFAASKPTVEAALTFIKGVLSQADKSDEEAKPLLDAVARLGDRSSAPEGIELITDKKAWKARREAAPFSAPIDEYRGLFAKL